MDVQRIIKGEIFMDKKMTSGEIAKKAGVSQKTIRLYDEKGLLKPSDYSEGNYRLYDGEALLVLEKIIALKQIGLSLEEIRENLVGSSKKSIAETLQEQIDMMEAKRYELEKAIKRIKGALVRSNGEPDWDDVAEVLKMMQEDQNKDEGHYFALEHSKGELDWYVKIYRYLQVEEGDQVLDLGCGYSKLWRNNWEDIPENVHVDAYDLAGSWADDFNQFVNDNKEKLSKNTGIDVFFEDVEVAETWKHIQSKKKYTKVVAHYLMDEIKDSEGLFERVKSVLEPNGMFSLNVFGNVRRTHFDYWNNVFAEVGIPEDALCKKLDERINVKNECREVLEKYFSSIEEVVVPCSFTFNRIEDIMEDLNRLLSGNEALIKTYIGKLEHYFEEKLQAGDIVIPHDESFFKIMK